MKPENSKNTFPFTFRGNDILLHGKPYHFASLLDIPVWSVCELLNYGYLEAKRDFRPSTYPEPHMEIHTCKICGNEEKVKGETCEECNDWKMD